MLEQLEHFFPRLETLNLIPEMYKILIPSFISGGRHDGNVPIAIANDAYENIGNH
jgi:hypothetical protein